MIDRNFAVDHIVLNIHHLLAGCSFVAGYTAAQNASMVVDVVEVENVAVSDVGHKILAVVMGLNGFHKCRCCF